MLIESDNFNTFLEFTMAVTASPFHQGKGPGGTYKTGQRVPTTGRWVDQHGVTSWHAAGATFPPCIGRKGECANRKPI